MRPRQGRVPSRRRVDFDARFAFRRWQIVMVRSETLVLDVGVEGGRARPSG